MGQRPRSWTMRSAGCRRLSRGFACGTGRSQAFVDLIGFGRRRLLDTFPRRLGRGWQITGVSHGELLVAGMTLCNCNDSTGTFEFVSSGAVTGSFSRGGPDLLE